MISDIHFKQDCLGERLFLGAVLDLNQSRKHEGAKL